MNRRHFLLSSGTATSLLLAGCVNPPNGPSQSAERPRVGKLSLNLPEGITAYPNLENTEHTKNPLRVSFTLENTSEIDYHYGEARTARFIGAKTENFALYPISAFDESDSYKYNDESDIWVAKTPFVQTEEYQINLLDANESETQFLVLLHQYYDVERELPPYPEELRFKAEFGMAESQEGVIDDPIECAVEFSIFPPETEAADY